MGRNIGNKNMRSLIAAMLLVCMFFSVFFIVAEAGHECHDDDCAICACIQMCEKQLSQIGAGLAGCVCVFLYIRVLSSVSSYSAVYPKAFLADHKVRLNI